MKIIHKKNAFWINEVQKEFSPVDGYNWWNVNQQNGTKVYYNELSWEEVPEQKWKDVTNSCIVNGCEIMYEQDNIRRYPDKFKLALYHCNGMSYIMVLKLEK